MTTTRTALVRNTAWNQGAQVTRMLSQFVLLPLIARRLGETATGIYFLAISFTAYFGILDSSFSQSLVKFVAEYRATGEDELLRSSVRAVFRVFALVGLVAAIALAAAGIWGLGLLKVPPDQSTVARSTFLVAAVASLATWPLTTFDNILRGAQRYDLVSKISIAVTATAFAGQLAVLAAGYGPPALLAVTLGALATGMLVSRTLARREVPEIRSGSGAPRDVLRRLAGFSLTLLAIGLTDLVIYQMDRTLVSVSAGVAAVTIYEFAARFHKVPRDLHAIAVSAAMPAASELDATGETERLARLLTDGTRFTVAVVVPISVAILALAGPLTRTYAPPEAFAPLLIFVAYWILNANTGVPSVILAGMGRLRILLVYSYAVAALNLVLSVALSRRYGVSGVVAGTTISYAVAFPVFIGVALRTIGVPLGRFARRAWWPAYPMAAVLGAVLVAASRPLSSHPSLVAVVAVGAVGVSAYLVTFWFVALSKAERADFAAALLGRRETLPDDSLAEEEIAAAKFTQPSSATKAKKAAEAE